MLSTKSSHSPTSPSEQTRALLHESGLPLLHFLPRMNGLPEIYGQGHITPNGLGVEPSAFFPMVSVGLPNYKGDKMDDILTLDMICHLHFIINTIFDL